MNDVVPRTDAPLTSTQAAEFISREYGLDVDRQSVARWAEQGLLVGRQRFRLAARRPGGWRLFTTEGIREFFARVEEARRARREDVNNDQGAELATCTGEPALAVA